jgi:ketosteroid isomerase-like protein
VSQHDFDTVIEAYRKALHEFVKGDAEAVLQLFSDRDDVTLANPLGPPRRGRREVEKATREAVATLSSGTVRFEEVSRYASADLGYLVELERVEAQLVGGEDMVRISLRVTSIFRREGAVWKVSHRHADPITTDRPVSTILET